MIKKIIGVTLINMALLATLSADTFQLKTIRGYKVKVSTDNNILTVKGLENKRVVLEFFGTHCPPCVSKVSEMNSEHSRDDTVVIAIEAQNSNREAIVSFIEENSPEYPIVSGEDLGAMQLVGYLAEQGKFPGYIPYVIEINPSYSLNTVIGAQW